MKLATILMAGGLAGHVAAHMEMIYPPPFRNKVNKYSKEIDYSYTSPLSPDGSNYPCKGYHSDFGTEAGKTDVTWTPGQTVTMKLGGSATHEGGSCQLGLSFDKGTTFEVIHSFVGGCPLNDSYDFIVPDDNPTEDAIFAWTWFNKVGNREMYMNCAAVKISGSGSSKVKRANRPKLFVANTNDGCTTAAGKDVVFPDPGPDDAVTRNTSNADGETGLEGSCGGGGSSSGGGGSSGGDDQSPPQDTNPAPSASIPAQNNGSYEPAPTQSSSPAPAAGDGGFDDGSYKPSPASEAAPEPTVAPNTLTTAVRPEPTVAVAPAPAPAPAPETPAEPEKQQPETASGSGDGQAYERGTPCESEGEWNCIGGSKFQRCASGAWSDVLDLYPGTACVPGKTMGAMSMSKKRSIRGGRLSRAVKV